MYGYIYLTTNNVNGKQYIGKKVSNEFIESYLGSGTLIKKAIKKYGKENFSVIIIEECETNEILNDREIFWISHYNAVNSEDFYNLAIGGEGSQKGSKKSDEWKQKMSISASKRKLDTATKQKISKTVSQQIWVNNGIIETKATESNLQDYLQNGFKRGRLKFSQSHIENMFKGRKGVCYMTDELKQQASIRMSGSNNPFFGKKHSENTLKQLSEIQSGRIWINKNGTAKRVIKDELDLYLKDGWQKGMGSRVQRLSKTDI